MTSVQRVSLQHSDVTTPKRQGHGRSQNAICWPGRAEMEKRSGTHAQLRRYCCFPMIDSDTGSRSGISQPISDEQRTRNCQQCI